MHRSQTKRRQPGLNSIEWASARQMIERSRRALRMKRMDRRPRAEAREKAEYEYRTVARPAVRRSWWRRMADRIAARRSAKALRIAA